MPDLSKTKKDLGNLLKFTQELLSVGERVVLDLADTGYPQFHECQIAGLEGIEVDCEDSSWLKAHRLRETCPPAYQPMFAGWVDGTERSSPNQPPKLVEKCVLRLPIEKISDLAEAGILTDPADVMMPVENDGAFPNEMDVCLRLGNMPEFRQLWQDYLDGPWKAWADAEKPRRDSIEFYNKAYQILQRMQATGDDTPIELVFGVGIARWRHGQDRINVPLIEQLVELEMEEDGTLLVHPREAPPFLSLRAFHALDIEGSKALQRDIGEQFDRIVQDPDRGFSPFALGSFENVLRACATRLSASGLYQPDETTGPDGRNKLPPIDQTLRITDSWVLFVRRRSEDVRKEDIRRLIEKIDKVTNEAGLPKPAMKFVEPPSDKQVDYGSGIVDILQSTLILPESTSGCNPDGSDANAGGKVKGATGDGDELYFFPLPYNDEQNEIIRRLKRDDTDGILVQGPPGTGKTHTIANIICHYLATRRRVLVTAKTPEALTALQEKIPEGIRDLAIAVIHSDREGTRQLERAVRLLSNEAKTINPIAVSDKIRDRQRTIATLKADISDIDAKIRTIGDSNFETLRYSGTAMLPMDLAKSVDAERDAHTWFPDHLTFDEKFDPKFGDADIEEIRGLRLRLSDILVYDVGLLPDPTKLPDFAQILATHEELTRVAAIKASSAAGKMPVMSTGTDGALEKAKSARAWLRGLSEAIVAIEGEQWPLDIYRMLIGARKVDQEALDSLVAVLNDWVSLTEQGRAHLLKGIVLPVDELDTHFDEAVEDLAIGRKPFGLFSFLKAGLKTRIDSIRIQGHPPGDQVEWEAVHAYRLWQQQVPLFTGRWNAVATVIEAPQLPLEGKEAEEALLRLGSLLKRVLPLRGAIDLQRRNLKALFPYRLDIDGALNNGKPQPVISAVDANLAILEQTSAKALKNDLLKLAGNAEKPFHKSLREFCSALGHPEVSSKAIASAWQSLTKEAARLHAAAEDLDRLDTLVLKVLVSGAENWATQLRYTIPEDGKDSWTPDSWHKSWDWARANGHLRSLATADNSRSLSEQRAKSLSGISLRFGKAF